MATALFITRNDIIKNTPLNGAIDADKLLPFVVTAQRKYMYNLLESKGIDKKILYRKFTTFPRSK